METFRQQKAFLTAISQDILAIVGEKGSANTILDNLAQQLQSFIDKPITIPSRLEAFQQNIAALASWYYDMVWFPLSIDYLTLSAPEQGTPEEMQNVNASFFDKLAYEVLAFIGSFTTDYTSVAGEAEETGDPLVVWVNNSRFQSSLIKKMADAAFTPRTGIPVSIRITSIGTGVSPMLLATAAGTGPDAAMFMANGEAVNYASRGAAVDMTQFDTYDEVAARFMPGSLTPYAYQGGGYGLPDMANFQMMYVRRDILDDLGLEPPETWEELITVLGTLQKNNLTIGIPIIISWQPAFTRRAGSCLPRTGPVPCWTQKRLWMFSKPGRTSMPATVFPWILIRPTVSARGKCPLSSTCWISTRKCSIWLPNWQACGISILFLVPGGKTAPSIAPASSSASAP